MENFRSKEIQNKTSKFKSQIGKPEWKVNQHKEKLDEGRWKEKRKKEVSKTAQDCGQKTQQQAYITTNFIKVRYSEKATKN